MNFKNISLFAILFIAGFVGTIAHAFEFKPRLDLVEEMGKKHEKLDNIEIDIVSCQKHVEKLMAFCRMGKDTIFSPFTPCKTCKEQIDILKELNAEYKETWSEMIAIEQEIADDLFRQIADQLITDENKLADAIEATGQK